MTRPSPFTGRSQRGSPDFCSTHAGGNPLSLVSLAVALAMTLASGEAAALVLGRLNIQSALGEPLRAEIEVSELGVSEPDGLRVNIASAESFRIAGVPYSSALSEVRVSLQKRTDGRYVVRLNGARPLNDPFVDVLIEANWSSGRVMRDYTVLLDPPASRQATAVNPVAPQLDRAPSPRMPVPSPATPDAQTAAAPRRPRPAPLPAQTPAPAAEADLRTGSGEQIIVRPGDTAIKIASAHKPADVSLDQMLVALLRANPEAFFNGNINRMKSGAVLEVPSASKAKATEPGEAGLALRAHSRDFGDYRQRLAENAPDPRTASADRQASGKVQPSIEARSATKAFPDRLTISQGDPAAVAAEDKLAQNRQAQATSARRAELSNNLNDLNRLQAVNGAPAAPAAGNAALAPITTPPPGTVPAVAALPPDGAGNGGATASSATGSAPAPSPALGVAVTSPAALAPATTTVPNASA
ncbi:MAG: hypothetical protein JWQ03_1187, partial [Variovorax sp.]|nr:hypothetical protein [Variovorax sp.]